MIVVHNCAKLQKLEALVKQHQVWKTLGVAVEQVLLKTFDGVNDYVADLLVN